MNWSLVKVVTGLAALVVTLLGLSGTYSYGQDYYLHRGFATVVQLRRAGTGRLLSVNFYSRALHRQADYLVYLPPGYNSSLRYPVYYLLHGMPGQPKVFIDLANMDVRLDNQLAMGHVRPMILVYPDGRIGASILSDSEWANTPSGNYESYVMEVVHNVDHHFSTLALRQDRVIGGFSAGAYGAINIALHHLSTFASVQVWSGYFTQTRAGVFSSASSAALAYDSPLNYVSRVTYSLAVDGLRVYMFGGRDDSSSGQIAPMAQALRVRGARVQYAIYPGGHDWGVWYPRLNQMLILASQAIGQVPRPVGVAATRKKTTKAATSPVGRRGSPGSPHVVLNHAHMRAVDVYGPEPSANDHHRPVQHRLLLIAALLLALASAAMINLGFVLQHRGLARAASAGNGRFIGALRSRSWLAGQAVGWMGFVAQMVSIAIAPLSLVQAFAAGGLAVSVPLARIFGIRVSRTQLLAVFVAAAALFSLPIGFAVGHGHMRGGVLIAATLIALLAASSLGLATRPWAQATAAGVFYGVADAAIKAESVALKLHGGGALLSGWTILAVVGTFGGFVSFQAALRDKHAVSAISLMSAFAALAAMVLGVLAFGESLGTSSTATIMHLAAIALVLACVPPLARTQHELTDPVETAPYDAADADVSPPQAIGAHDDTQTFGPRILARVIRAVLATGGATAALLVLLVCSLAGVGLLFGLRNLHWLTIGPRIPDALPLLQLPGFDAQPSGRVIAAWLSAGIVLGLTLVRVCPVRRFQFTALIGALVLLFASDASFALAHNLRLNSVLLDRSPTPGPWLECLLLAAGSALPRSIARRRPSAVSGPTTPRATTSASRVSLSPTKPPQTA